MRPWSPHPSRPQKYGYSIERAQAEASPEEQAVVNEPPPDVQEAQGRIHAYEARVCLSEQPGAADVTFEGPTDTDYCESTMALNQMLDFTPTAYSPESVEAVLNSVELRDAIAAGITAAPPEISDDVATIAAFDLDAKIPLIAEYGYDFRRLLLEATPAERLVLQSSDPVVIDAYRRVAAYEEQWCPGE